MKSIVFSLLTLVASSALFAQEEFPASSIPMLEANGAFGGGYYVGESVGGVPEGKGSWYLGWGDGESYGVLTGEFKNGLPNGFGILNYEGGASYEGEWLDDEHHGKGVYTYKNGDTYVGDFDQGKQTGKHVYTTADGNTYVGDVVDGIRTGKGAFTWSSGNSYVGDWLNDKQHGKGIYTFKNGVIEGDFIQGSFEYPLVNIFVAHEKKDRLKISLLALAMGSDIDFSVTSKDWYKPQSYTVEIAKQMRYSFEQCVSAISKEDNYSKYLIKVNNQLELAIMKSSKVELENTKEWIESSIYILASKQCLSRFTTIMQAHGLDIFRSKISKFESFFNDLIDVELFWKELSYLMKFDYHMESFVYGPTGPRASRLAIRDVLAGKSENLPVEFVFTKSEIKELENQNFLKAIVKNVRKIEKIDHFWSLHPRKNFAVTFQEKDAQSCSLHEYCEEIATAAFGKRSSDCSWSQRGAGLKNFTWCRD